MWEVLLTLCLAGGDPAGCETRRIPGGETYLACVETASEAARAHGPRAAEWPCVEAGTAPDFRVTEVAPGVFVHRGRVATPDPENGGDIANLGFVVGGEAVAVIDAGSTPEIGRALLEAIRARTDLPVRWLILTHMHPDHVLGASVFADAGATVIGHARLPAALSRRADGYRAAIARQLGETLGPESVVLPSETVESVREIDLGGRVLRLEAHPVAHTEADLTVRDLTTGAWFLGDLLFADHFPSLDGSLRGWIAEMAALASRDAPLVIPGHGPVALGWPGGAAALRAYLDRLAETAREAIERGTPMLEATRAIAAERADGWSLADAFAERNATAAIRELEWE